MAFSQALSLTRLDQLYRLSRHDLTGQSSGAVFNSLLEQTVHAYKATGGSLLLYQNKADKTLTIVSALDLLPGYIGRTLTEHTGIAAWVIDYNRPLRLTGDARCDSRFQFSTAYHRPIVPAVSLTWPLSVNNNVIGAISVNHRSNENQLTDADLTTGELWAGSLALIIDNMPIYADGRQKAQEFISIHNLYTNANRQLQQMQNRLQQSDKRLHDTLDSLDSVVWSIRPDTFAPFFFNQAAEEVYGYPISRLLAEPHLWLDIILPKDSARMETCLKDIVKSGAQKITYRIAHADGHQHWLFSHMRYIAESDEGPAHIDGITVDITQYKSAQDLLQKRNYEIQTALDKLQEVQQQLLQSEKMASVGQLAAGVAHEINNPIGYINSNLTSLKIYINDLLKLLALYEAAEKYYEQTAQGREIIEFKKQMDLNFVKDDILDLLVESFEGANRVKKIVQDLKDFSHLGGHEDWQWSNLHTGLESTLNIVNNEIKYKAKVVKEFGDIPEVNCLPHQLNQVFMNLLVNAAHAIEHEGVITLKTGIDGAHVWIEIGDTGKGIDPQHMSKIFDPFFTTKPVGKGTGLGLSVSYNIIKKHQGDIQITSKVNEGTVFKIVLPIAGPTADAFSSL
jgi:two-component system NtrC family sensor kinase